ncbi:hypothetical protein N2152v2_003997 [Parachlorella kessleri]
MEVDTPRIPKFSGVLQHCTTCPGFFASVTVVGVADEPPAEVFERFCHPLNHPSVFSSVKAVEELSRKDEEGLDGRHLSQVEIRQHVEMQLFGKSITAPMRLHLKADHSAQQLRFSMLEGNALMRKLEGVYAVLPFDEDSPAQQDLLAIATSVVGQVLPTTRSRSSSGSCSPRSLESSMPLGKSQEKKGPQRSIVIMHQRVKPFMAPPPPFNRLLRGHLAHQFETMMHELLAACNLSAQHRRAAEAAAAAEVAAAAAAASAAAQATTRAGSLPAQLQAHVQAQAGQAVQFVSDFVKRQRSCRRRKEPRPLLERSMQGLLLGGALTLAMVGVMQAVIDPPPRKAEC